MHRWSRHLIFGISLLLFGFLLAACSSDLGTDSTIDVRSSNYKIDLHFVGQGFTAERRQIFLDAATRWASIITGDLPSVTLNQPQKDICGFGEGAISGTIDDLLIIAIIGEIDGKGKILGAAFPSLVRRGNELTAIGCMVFDSADIAELSEEELPNIVLHEMGHVLGIGSFWQPLNGFNSRNMLEFRTNSFMQACNSAKSFSQKPLFLGDQANREWQALGKTGKVPVEDEYGVGTQCSHWDEGIFAHELMTGFSNEGEMPLSRLTIASLADLGYEVDFSKADPYQLPTCLTTCLHLQEAQHQEPWELVFAPRGMIDANGTVSPLDNP
ncbi:MAG: hypothetical protein KC422_24290 [Trueperaceae bacterium]|nr:hypothetical protein [Trueperaceae bacterium]